MTWFLTVGTDAVLGVFALMLLALSFRFRLRVVIGVAGVAVAYALSEVIKLVVREDRPCRATPSLAECPPVGDWSFPSNHSVIAGAAAVAIFVLHRALGWVALVVALTAAASRVVVGVHYPHDVIAGLLLGALVSFAIARLARPRVRVAGDVPAEVMHRMR